MTKTKIDYVVWVKKVGCWERIRTFKTRKAAEKYCEIAKSNFLETEIDEVEKTIAR